MADLKSVIKGQEEVVSYFQATTNTCGFEDKARAALISLQEPRKTREEVLMAIVSALGYTDVEVFKQTVESTNDTDDYFLGGMYRAVKAVEELFVKDSDHK